MANIICNQDFEYGLSCWTQTGGVEVVEEVVPVEIGGVVTEVSRRLARIPPAGFLAQYLHDWTTTHDLHFNWYSLGSSWPGLQVRVDYTDGTHKTHALTGERFSRDPNVCRPDLEVDNNRLVRSIQLVNFGAQPSGVNWFELRGEPARLCGCVRPQPSVPWSRGRLPAYPSASFLPGWLPNPAFDDDQMLAARFFEIDMKLEKILELLRSKQRPPVTKPSGKAATKK